MIFDISKVNRLINELYGLNFSSPFIWIVPCTIHNGLVIVNLYINLACLFVCLSVCLFVSNKRQNGWNNRAQIFCGSSRDPREGLWMIKFSKICLYQNSNLKILKIHEIFCFCYLLFRKKNFTNQKDGREAPWFSSI